LRLLIPVACEGFLKDKCGPRAKKFEHHCSAYIILQFELYPFLSTYNVEF